MADAVVTGLRVVAIPVTDQDRAIDFYGDVLGFEKTMDGVIDEMSTRWVEMTPPGSPVSIALVPAYEGFTAARDTGIRFTTPDAAALHARIRAAGGHADELLQWEGIPPMFDFFDPDGNTLYAMQ
ncbi:VOC family protein [Rhodococcus sp. P1Y]|uniref:VOC family protein n=1 Tax=Rhodococcus sp. P1Y TaxID=1302308 RepID=UPI000EB43B08|nr:VOC family protein [Rhodococcus sp. P1Y]AYJ47864.1 hypothetical protein D8W71_05360 [Rhodococcus sp. P1Y]